MLRYEKDLYLQGYQAIAGIDEVGRGPLAGPVVAACVILPKTVKSDILMILKIPKKKHEEIYKQVVKVALAIGIGRISSEIDWSVNIYEATKMAMLQAIDDLQGLLADRIIS